MDTLQSECRLAALQLGQHGCVEHLKAHYCPSRALVLVQLSTGSEHVFRLLNFHGEQLATCTPPSSVRLSLQCFWLPAAHAVAFHGVLESEPALCSGIWVFGQPCSLGWGADSLAWATPESGALAVGQSDTLAVTLISGHIAVAAPHLSARPPGCMCWGARLVVLPTPCSGTLGCDQLYVFLVDGATHLRLQQTVPAGCRATAGLQVYVPHVLQVSPDGQLCAAVTASPVSVYSRLCHRHLAVVHLTSGRLREYALKDADLAHRLESESLQVCWSPDSTAVLVHCRGWNELLRFAR